MHRQAGPGATALRAVPVVAKTSSKFDSKHFQTPSQNPEIARKQVYPGSLIAGRCLRGIIGTGDYLEDNLGMPSTGTHHRTAHRAVAPGHPADFIATRSPVTPNVVELAPPRHRLDTAVQIKIQMNIFPPTHPYPAVWFPYRMNHRTPQK